MKKTLIALAAVAVSTGAMAQAHNQVTISGTLDVSAINNTKNSTIANNKPDTAANRESIKATLPGNQGWSTSELRFAGTEDLGGGLKASFQLNTGLSGGNQAVANRDRFLNLSGGFGAVRIGSFTPASDGSPSYAGAGSGNIAGDSDGITNTSAHGRRLAMQYTTPNFSGMTASLVYGAGSTDTDKTAGKAGTKLTGFALAYNQGPLRAGAGSSRVTTNTEAVAAVDATGACFLNADGVATTTGATNLAVCPALHTRIGNDPVDAKAAGTTKSTQNWIGASYNLGVATVAASHKTNKTSSAGVNSADIRINTLGVTVPVGAVTLTASMYSGKDKVSGGADDNYKLEGHQVTARYALSKRTFVYAAMGEADRKREGGNTTKGAASKLTQTVMGLSHSF